MATVAQYNEALSEIPMCDGSHYYIFGIASKDSYVLKHESEVLCKGTAGDVKAEANLILVQHGLLYLVNTKCNVLKD